MYLPFRPGGAWQRAQQVVLLGTVSFSHQLSQRTSQLQTQGLWFRCTLSNWCRGVKRSWGRECRELWERFSSSKFLRSSKALRSMTDTLECISHSLRSETRPWKDPGRTIPSWFPDSSNSSSRTNGVRLGMSFKPHMPRFKKRKFIRPSKAASEMKSSFLSSPRSRRRKEGTRWKANAGSVSIGLFLSHSSLSLLRYSKAWDGTTVRRLSKSSSVLRLGRPLKAPTSICRMWFFESWRISKCRRCLNVSDLIT